MKIVKYEELNPSKVVFVDTRTPKEFEEDHIPNAINLPILTNEERALVGTLYKQVSRKEAIDKGVEFFSQKLPGFMKEIGKYRDKEIVINCWRGGMRSRAVTALLDSLGFNVSQLEGGYKAYREHVRERLYNYDFKPKLIILWGLTCTGKTELLSKLDNSLDLEGLAQHRSSLYGAVGLKPNSQKRFETLLLENLDELNKKKIVFVEGESRRIGDVIIPEKLWKKICKGKNVHIVRNLDNRAKAAVKEYFDSDQKIMEIKKITESLWKVISKENKQKVIENIDNNDYHSASKILLEFYYDPLYSHTLKQIKFDCEISSDDVNDAVKNLLDLSATSTK